jgi:hypothetical protein
MLALPQKAQTELTGNLAGGIETSMVHDIFVASCFVAILFAPCVAAFRKTDPKE